MFKKLLIGFIALFSPFITHASDQESELHSSSLPIPAYFRGIKEEIQYDGGKAILRPLTVEDINETFIQRTCAHDPTDPMESSDPNDPLPTVEEMKESAISILEGSSSFTYGIFNTSENDTSILGSYSLLEGQHFYNSIEATMRIHPDFRGLHLGSSVAKVMRNHFQIFFSQNPDSPIHYLEASINETNLASRTLNLNAGMIQFKDSILYYHPLKKDLPAPTLRPLEETIEDVNE